MIGPRRLREQAAPPSGVSGCLLIIWNPENLVKIPDIRWKVEFLDVAPSQIMLELDLGSQLGSEFTWRQVYIPRAGEVLSGFEEAQILGENPKMHPQSQVSPQSNPGFFLNGILIHTISQNKGKAERECRRLYPRYPIT
jgi:hypothetical protein